MRSCLIDRPGSIPFDLRLWPLRELDRSLPGAPGTGTIVQIRAECDGTQRTSNHARAEPIDSASQASAATANIPSPRLRAEKAPPEQSRLFPFCNLTLKTKRNRPWYDRPASSLLHDPKSGADGCLIKLDRREPDLPASTLEPAISGSCAETRSMRSVIFAVAQVRRCSCLERSRVAAPDRQI